MSDFQIVTDTELEQFGADFNVDRKFFDGLFGVWAIEPQRFNSIINQVRGVNLVAHVQANAFDARQGVRGEPSARRDDRNYQITGNGVAVIRARGPLMKRVSSMSAGTSTVFMRRQIREAIADPDVSAILLIFDSPGGTVAGTMDLAQDIAAAAAQKPTWSFLEDLTASAAMWLASQTSRIIANNETALVGSIGTYAVLHDLSAAADELGVKVHVVRAGEFKGAGEPGTVVEPKHIAEMQRVVNALNDQFIRAVARGRGVSEQSVRSIADGRIHPAAEALSLGLVDAIDRIDSVIDQLSQQSQPTRRTATMTTNTVTPTAPTAASLNDLRAAFPNADSDFILSQLEANADLQTAAVNYANALQQKLAAASQNPAAPPAAPPQPAAPAAVQQPLIAAPAPQTAPATPAPQPTADPSGITGFVPGFGYVQNGVLVAPIANQTFAPGTTVPAASVGIGIDPITPGASAEPVYQGDTGDVEADFDTAVRQMMDSGVPRRLAVAKVSKSRPRMWGKYLVDSNGDNVLKQRLVSEKVGVELSMNPRAQRRMAG